MPYLLPSQRWLPGLCSNAAAPARTLRAPLLQPSTAPRPRLREVLPSQGAVFVERSLSEVLCKPKILGIKSVALEKVEAIEKEGAALAAKARAATARG